MPVFDSTITISLITLLALCTLVSSALNPIVFRHNYRKRSSVPRILFMALTICDFITCLIIPVKFMVGSFIQDDGCWDNHTTVFCESSHYMFYKVAGPVQKTETVVAMVVSFLPGSITGLRAISRLYTFTFTFRRVNPYLVVGVLWSIIVYMTVCFVCIVASPGTLWFAYNQMSWNLAPFWGTVPSTVAHVICTLPSIVLQLAAVVASVLTIRLLMVRARSPMTSQAQRNFVRGTVVILATNGGSMVFLVAFAAMLVYHVTVGKFTYSVAIANIMYSTLTPCLVSAANPAVYCAFTRNVLQGVSSEGDASRAKSETKIRSVVRFNMAAKIMAVHPAPPPIDNL